MARLPVALPIAQVVALPIALPIAEAITNIGTTDLTRTPPNQTVEQAQRYDRRGLPVARRIDDPNQGVHQRVLPGGIVEALPVARHVEEGPGEQYVLPFPLWIARWQPSATIPLSKAPWIIGYRFFIKGAVYQGLGLMPHARVDLKFKPDKGGYSHEHAYEIDEERYAEFRALTTSVGQWLHQRILGQGWTNTNKQCVGASRNWALN